ncbi:hypothetical protein AAL_02473 [Moelleriella libera RCEF 2490]|uniref:Uncharacterized protein n=1 Tax=Moelleriella libera RCEF 2490 TaxID=1081109 RepID=A0A162IVB9_9HYPO|nr:hypothetical protein AAL_02473 [Moelleriella libera RCEF 2490]
MRALLVLLHFATFAFQPLAHPALEGSPETLSDAPSDNNDGGPNKPDAGATISSVVRGIAARPDPKAKEVHTVATVNKRDVEIQARGEENRRLKCGPGDHKWHYTPERYIKDNINSMKGWRGRLRIPKGHAVCGMLACTDSSSVWACNDDKDNDLVLEDGFRSIAADVEELRSRCRVPLGPFRLWEDKVLGQFFLTPTFNIFVRKEPQGCGNLDPV